MNDTLDNEFTDVVTDETTFENIPPTQQSDLDFDPEADTLKGELAREQEETLQTAMVNERDNS